MALAQDAALWLLLFPRLDRRNRQASSSPPGGFASPLM